MRKHLRPIILLPMLLLMHLPVLPLSAQPAEQFREAAQAYRNTEYAAAIRALQDLVAQGYATFPVYYNLGNACYKNGDLGGSMLYYEKALLLDPGNEDVLHNIRVVRARTRDRVEPIPLLFFVRWWNDLKQGHLPGTFFVWSLVLAWMLAAALFVFFGFRGVGLRRVALTSVILTSLLFAGTVTLYSSRLEQIDAHRSAIVMDDEAMVRSTPDATGVESFTVHEGLKVEILESRESYYRIRLADGKNGWIPRSAVERI